MGQVVHIGRGFARQLRRHELPTEPAHVIIMPVTRIERQPHYNFYNQNMRPLPLTPAERRALGARWGLDENGNPLAGTPKL